jgi:hypothetical protein
MLLVINGTAADCQALFGIVLIGPPLGDQLTQQVGEFQLAIMGGRDECGHKAP